MQGGSLTEEEKQRQREDFEKREREYTRLQRTRMTAADFEPLTVIGRGAFGEVRASHRHITCCADICTSVLVLQVRLCREKTTGKVVAVKKLQKSEMLRRGQVSHALRSPKAKARLAGWRSEAAAVPRWPTSKQSATSWQRCRTNSSSSCITRFRWASQYAQLKSMQSSEADAS